MLIKLNFIKLIEKNPDVICDKCIFFFGFPSLYSNIFQYQEIEIKKKKNGEEHIAVVSRLKWYKFLDNMD